MVGQADAIAQERAKRPIIGNRDSTTQTVTRVTHGRQTLRSATRRLDSIATPALGLVQRVVGDGDIITAAGVTSGIDLALHLVEAELGTAAANAGAREIEWTRNATPVA